MADKKTIEKTKLIQLLSSFSSLEWKRFGRFVQSPYHNTNQKVIDLYFYLKKAFPFDDLKPLEQDRVYKKIFGKVPFKPNNFQSLCSDLYGLAADFIIDVHLRKEKRKREKFLIDALSERNYELFKGASKQLIKEVEKKEYFLDEEDLLLLYQLNNGLWHHLENDQYTVHQEELHQTVQYAKHFYQTLSIQLDAEVRGLNNYVSNEKKISRQDTFQIPQYYKAAINLHEHKQTEHYFRLKAKILKNWGKIKQKHKVNLLVHLINFSLTNELIIKEFGYQEPFELYKIATEERLFIVNGKMRDIEFFNTCIMGINLGQSKWVRAFIADHQHYLSKELNDFLVPLVYAYDALFKENYEEIIDLLSKLNPINNLNYLGKIKRLLLRAYFEGILNGEEQYITPFNYEMASMKKMITRNKKLSDTKAKAINNFLDILVQLLRLALNKGLTLSAIQSFDVLLSQTKPLILKSWLQKKLLEIKNAAPL